MLIIKELILYFNKNMTVFICIFNTVYNKEV